MVASVTGSGRTTTVGSVTVFSRTGVAATAVSNGEGTNAARMAPVPATATARKSCAGRARAIALRC
jgi:hypothetical protein